MGRTEDAVKAMALARGMLNYSRLCYDTQVGFGKGLGYSTASSLVDER